uniref:Serine/threonine-protein phosphatase PGAM5, mitochondrial n=1 Tax=Globodera pallida TaxID=36090 RepID=A0A183BJ74_GLOPA
MNQFYAVDAFLRDSECTSSLDALLKRLNGIRIAAPTNSSLLNAWTPSPLMLSGLIKGTPIVRAAHTSRCAVAGVPLDVPSSSLSPNGLLPMGKGFRTGSSSPSAASSSAVLLQDDALAAVDAVSMTIASGEEQIVAEFGMEADQLLLVAEQTDGPISAEEQHQQQGASSSSAAAMADDLESVYSHPSMMEDHSSSSMLNSVLVGTSEHHQRRRQNAQNYYNSNNKWIMASMPTEELSAEVVVHRKAKQRHRRRTMSRSSCGGGSDSSCGGGGGGGGADGSSSRCQSSANLHTFAESVESKEENASTVTDAGDEERQHRAAVGAADNVQQQQQEAPVFGEEMPAFIALNDALSTEGTAMGFDIEQLQNQPHFFVNSSLPSSPPFGTSLQDELLAAAAAAVAEKEEDGGERFAGEELARKKFSATDEQQQHQQMARDLLINSKIVSSSAKVSFSYSTDSMDDELLHNTSGSVPALPATFDEALRNFLGPGGAEAAPKQSGSSPQQLTSSPTTALAQSAAATNGHSATKRGSAATVTAFLFLAKELAPEPFKREEREAKNQLDAEEELITVPLPPSVAQQQLQRRPPWTTMSARTTKTYNTSSLVVEGQQQQVDDVDEPYRLPRRLYRLTQIPRELGLDSQEFRCAACRRNIGASFGPFNVCALNGRYYCAGHCIRASGAADNEATLIPARIMNGFGTDSVDNGGSSKVLQRWDHNWDKRDPLTLLDDDKYQAADKEGRKQMLAKVTPTATRNIFLIRHGQYVFDSELRHLTDLGREQADLLGKRLAEHEVGTGKKFNKCFVSTLHRANETAQIALEHLPHVAQLAKKTDLLVEGAPCPPDPSHNTWKPSSYEFYADGARIEAAFRKHIHRAKPKQKENSYELYFFHANVIRYFVCRPPFRKHIHRAKPKQKENSYELYFFHANVIRYFVCRALQFPPEGWLRIGLANTSITWLQIRPSGRLTLRAMGDCGHLGPEKVTFN